MHGSGPGQGLHPLDIRGETLLQVLKNKGSVTHRVLTPPPSSKRRKGR